MPAEEPNKADELLKRYAKTRREQGGAFSLHPATRRLLHSAIAREHGPAARSKPSLLAWLTARRYRVFLGAGAAAVLFIFTWKAWDSQTGKTVQLARLESDAEKESLVSGKPDDLSRAELRESLEAPTVKNTRMDVLAEKQVSLNGVADSSSKLELGQLKPDSANRNQGVSSNSGLMRLGDSLAVGPASGSSTALNYRFVPAEPAAIPSPNVALETRANLGFSRSAITNEGLLAKGDYYAKDSPAATPAPAGGASVADNRFGGVSEIRLRSEAKEQATNLTLLTRSATRDGDSAGLAAPSVNSPATASGQDGARGAAKAAALAAEPLGTVSASSSDANIGVVFYRQLEPGESSRAVATAENLDAADKKSMAEMPVLQRFTVEQRGNTLRMTEPDGSVYEGQVGEGSNWFAESNVSGLEKLKRESVSRPSTGESRRYLFRAVGTNRALGQQVVVSGRFTADEISSAGAIAGIGGKILGPASVPPGAPAAVPPPTRPAPATRAAGQRASPAETNRISAIEGTVRIGSSNEQSFKAVRAPR